MNTSNREWESNSVPLELKGTVLPDALEQIHSHTKQGTSHP